MATTDTKTSTTGERPRGAPWSYREAAGFLGMCEKQFRYLAQLGRVRTIKLGVRKVAVPDAEVQRIAREGIA